MDKGKAIERGLTGLGTNLEIVNKLEKGEKVKGYCLCPACNGSGWGEKPFEYCKVCFGVQLFREKI